jgi:hypothetical protein
MAGILENIFIMISTVIVLLGAGYLVLVIVGWGMKLKGGHREQEGLANMLSTLESQQDVQNASTGQQSDNND